MAADMIAPLEIYPEQTWLRFAFAANQDVDKSHLLPSLSFRKEAGEKVEEGSHLSQVVERKGE
jgi:hypothetical protein